MLRAIAYCRVSCAKQLQGDSFRRQEAVCREAATKRGAEIVTVIKHVGSAFRTTKLLEELVEYCEASPVEYGLVIVEDFDRISRAGPERAFPLVDRMSDAGWHLFVPRS